jgi:hypothetical protein
VRQSVGEPIKFWPPSQVPADSTLVLLLDVSSAMKTLFSQPNMENFIASIADAARPAKLVGADTRLIGSWPPTHDGLPH